MSIAPQRILHPTDFSDESNLALAHALRIALANQAELVLLHVNQSRRHEHFPSVRKLLHHWNLLDQHASRSDVAKLGIGIDKIEAYGGSVVGSIANYLDHHPVDMLVMATHGRHGLAGWLDRSTAEDAARRTETSTLFFPADCRGFVSDANGEVRLQQIVVPVDHCPSSEAAVQRATRALGSIVSPRAKLTLLHVGAQDRFPAIDVTDNRFEVERVCRQGSAVSEILSQTHDSAADLLIMATEGRHGFYDVLRGTTTEQVLHGSPCPVLAVPALPVD